ncbi:hypothetical protein HAAEEKHM_00051 [Sinorhizobium phage AP-16-3]|nr:hypothetical protein HAAEEKHM_00051 [Sinorhizobium phage AP-16-3]
MGMADQIVSFIEKCGTVGIQSSRSTFCREYVLDVIQAQKKHDINFARVGADVICSELIDGLRDIYERSFHSDEDSTLEIRRITSSLLAKHGGAQ